MDDILVFNIAFGKTVSDISANAIANLGYADVRFLEPVLNGDTLSCESEVIGLRATSGGDSGVVYVRSTAYNQYGRAVLTWVRWVLVRNRDSASRSPDPVLPTLPNRVEAADLAIPPVRPAPSELFRATGSNRLWHDFAVGDRIDHPIGMTLDESDHTLATKLYQNPAKVHFDALEMASSAHRRRLVYGGHVISVCRAASYDGLENVLAILAINGGSHRAPTFAGDTLYSFTEVIDKMELPANNNFAALRLRLCGVKNQQARGFLDHEVVDGKRRFHPDLVLDLDYTVLMARR